MLDFEVQRCTRKCAKTDRDLKPGETFFAALVVEGADVVRLDYAAEAWEGPPENAIGWWKSQMPDPKANRMHWAPSDVMLHYFEQLGPETLDGDEEEAVAIADGSADVSVDVGEDECRADDEGANGLTGREPSSHHNADVRYVLALLMVRKRICRLEDSETMLEEDDEVDAEDTELEGENLILYCPRNEKTYRVPVVEPDAERIQEIEEELGQLLYSGDSQDE